MAVAQQGNKGTDQVVRVGLCSGWRATRRTTIDADHSCGCVGAYRTPSALYGITTSTSGTGGRDEDEDQHQYPSQASTFRVERGHIVQGLWVTRSPSASRYTPATSCLPGSRQT